MKKPDQKIRNYFSLAAGITQEDSIKKKQPHFEAFQCSREITFTIS